MTLLANSTLAQSQALGNLTANLQTLDKTQPQLRQWVVDQLLHLEWVYGRDRTLTAIDEFGQWHAGCSLPGRAARAMLDKLQITGAVGCFLAPPHAAHLRVALDTLPAERGIIAILPEMRDLAILLHCHDFAESIRSHRLWLAAGPAWDVILRELLDRNPGLATPTQFIRTPDIDVEQSQAMIATAQEIFSAVSAARSSQLQATTSRAVRAQITARPKICVVAPSRFRLWNDLGELMIRALDEPSLELVRFDADDPLCSSPLALANTANECDAIFTANTARSDLPGLIASSIPWYTWITSNRIPSAAIAGPDDRLLLVDASLQQSAQRAGWPANRLHLVGWPAVSASSPKSGGGTLSIIADTFGLETPKDLLEYSSHSILWERIAAELTAEPLRLEDIPRYLQRQMQQASIGEDAFPRARFIEKLILPAYQQGLARLLIRSKISLRVYGEGWNQIADFKPYCGGAIRSRIELADALGASTALLHVWPGNPQHAITATGLPIISPERSEQRFIKQARQAVHSELSASHLSVKDRLSGQLVLRFLRSTTSIGGDTIC